MSAARLLATTDDRYEALLDLHQDLDAEASALLNARLVLLLMNEIDDGARLAGLLDAARLVSPCLPGELT
ncbi:DUF2783 domain-containing protein [Paraburkholderia unamae]|uniref:Uncharacterized protein DUF2783 n=1 Tax=Paraburkholderia unamae TaxID=219649 RepID=A0ABX5KS76_9BURK|nr:DUF2783 domain-containing protein [Paraburkholderia unamae]PVX84927.1 uncharacterized protein DUF2783 [Paraburkholderia unamae]RAR65979.1 uncharacterized protein DUF2783 [Paraburkholderia unamae]CAG9266670.1 conserved hypothetical protein [Paraburkholderia unamae]